MLVDRSPQQIRLAAQRHEHFVQMPCATRLAPSGFGALGESSAKLLAPATDRFVADHDTAFEHNSSISRRLRLNRKYQRTAQLMTMAGKR